jgi:diguanylate cyclase (GGDEF)-like protein/PAS domain S-box-containing protein
MAVMWQDVQYQGGCGVMDAVEKRPAGEPLQAGSGLVIRIRGIAAAWRVQLTDAIESLRHRHQRRVTVRNFHSVVAQLQDMLLVADLRTLNVVELNNAARSALGYSGGDLRRLNLVNVLDELQLAQLLTACQKNSTSRGAQCVATLRKKSGGSLNADISVTLIAAPRPLICIAARDSSERTRTERVQRENQRQLAHIALHDALTGLPNRRYLYGPLQAMIQQLAHDPESRVCVVYLDIDHFKQINDSHGHACGDAVLRTLADRLRNAVIETDVVLRMGGDEFVIVAAIGSNDRAIDRLAEKLSAAVRAPMVLDGRRIDATVSMGLALIPQHGTDLDAVLKNADAALYAAKGDGRACHRLFAAPGGEDALAGVEPGRTRSCSGLS